MILVTFCRLFVIGFLFSIHITTTEGFITRPGLRCWGNPVDIAFVLDSSTSIWKYDYEKQLDFVNYMIDHLDIGMGPTQVRVGVETFSDFAQVRINFDESKDITILKKRISNISHTTGLTNIGDALNQLLSSMFRPDAGSRPNVKHVAIIMTDGTSQDPKATQEAAKKCRDANILLVVIGIGDHITYSELEGIASEPKSHFLFHTPNYTTLDRIHDRVIQQACDAVTTLKPTITTTPVSIPSDEACKNKKADIFFLLDSSSSIGIEEFKKEINVIENIVTRFDISPTKTRVGVSAFGHESFGMLNFDNGDDKAKALDEIRNIKYKGGGTETGKALNEVRNHVFNQASIRPEAERILVLFTDGQSRNVEQTSAEARLLRESGVKIFVVGISQAVDRIELDDISSKPSVEFVYTFATFDILLAESGLLAHKTCTVNPPPIDPKPCNATQRTDVVFMVSNNHFGKLKTDRILKASAEVLRRVRSRDTFQFGSIFDECLQKQDKIVGSINDESQLVSFNYGSIASLVRKLRLESFSSGTLNVRKVGLLFLDNTIDLNDPDILREVKRALFSGIELYAVIVGDGVNLQLIENSIAPKERIIDIRSYDDIISYLPSQFTEALCERSNGQSTFKPVLS